MAAWVSALLSPTMLLLLVLLLLTFWFLKRPGKSYLHLPPGPFPLPIIGTLHLIDLRRQDLSFMKLSERYGPVFTLYYGSERVVVLTGFKTVKEALVTKANTFKDRASIEIFNKMQEGNGMFFSSGEQWKATRRYTLTRMRDLGMGKTYIEEKILEELKFLVEKIESLEGKPFKMNMLTIAPANITATILFGSRFDYSDPLFRFVLQTVNEVVIQLGTSSLQIFNAFPFLGFFLAPPKIILKRFEEARTLLKGILSARRESFSENDLRNYIDALLFKQQEETSKDKKMFHDANILASAMDIVLAGTETTATTLQWGVLLMMKYPEIQRKVQAEIKAVIGLDRLPTFEDWKQMPFANAVVHEIQRFANLLPHLGHRSTADSYVCGYFIPKGTTVIPSITSVLYDKTQWETPFRFNPNHFLDAEGHFVMRDAFLPFSAGQRRCVGETLAKMEVFLFFVGLLQKFTFQPSPGLTSLDLDLTADVTFLLRPKPYSTCVVPCK